MDNEHPIQKPTASIQTKLIDLINPIGPIYPLNFDTIDLIDKPLLFFLIKYSSMNLLGSILPTDLIVIIFQKLFTSVTFSPSQEVQAFYDWICMPFAKDESQQIVNNYFNLEPLINYNSDELVIEHIFNGQPFEFHIYGDEFAHVTVDEGYLFDPSPYPRLWIMCTKTHIITNRITYWEEKASKNKAIHVNKYTYPITKIMCEKYTSTYNNLTNKRHVLSRSSYLFDGEMEIASRTIDQYPPFCRNKHCNKSHKYIYHTKLLGYFTINQFEGRQKCQINLYSNECFDLLHPNKHISQNYVDGNFTMKYHINEQLYNDDEIAQLNSRNMPSYLDTMTYLH